MSKSMSKKSGSKVDVETKTADNLCNAVNAILGNNPALLDEPNSSYWGWTALMKAAAHGHLSIAELLLNRGCAIDKQDMLGATALMYAAYNGQTDVARVLLVRGADLTLIGTWSGSTGDALGHAKARGHTAIVELIEREGCWRRRRNWMLFSSMFKDSLRTSTAPIDSSLEAVYNALAMDEITRFIAKML